MVELLLGIGADPDIQDKVRTGCMHVNLIMIRLTHMNVWESTWKLAGACTQFKKGCIFTASYVRICIRYCKTCIASERAMKSKVGVIKSLSP